MLLTQSYYWKNSKYGGKQYKDRDFGVETAINTLKYVRKLQTFYLRKRGVVGALVDENIEALKQVDGLIQKHLEDRYGITQIKQ